MARVTAAQVKQIIDTSLSDTIVDAYILAANYAVSEVLGDDTSLASGHKAEIERWLSAHLIAATREQQPIEEGAGGAKIKYQGLTGKGLESTMYGQQVLALDATGKMMRLSKRTATMTAITSFD